MTDPVAGRSAAPHRRFGLRTLLTAFTLVALCATAAVGSMSLWGAREAREAATRTFVAKDVTADVLPPPMYLIEMRLVLSLGVEGTLPPEQARAEMRRLDGEYQARVKYWTDNPPYGLQARLLGEQHRAAVAFIAAAGRVLDALDGNAEAALVHAALGTAHTAYLSHRAGVDDTVKESVAFADASVASFDATARTMASAQWALLALAALLLSAFGVWIRRAVWAAVGGEPALAAAIARSVARGDLSGAVPAAAGDGGSILATIGQMSAALAAIVAQVRASSDSIATGSGEIAQGNHDLGARTEQQASALQQAAASMAELKATVGQNADSARQANQLALDASSVAQRGGDVVGRMVATMQGIHDSSSRIADIIGVIDGIAFQTNILALNAAVEAARAGEQGRGFAVVAAEVRSLAGRSAAAAREIKGLVGTSVTRVAQGSELVAQAGATMGEVVGAIRRVADILGRISQASAAQQAGVAQVGEAVGQMDQATQQNAALVEQSTAAAESLKQQADQLVDVVALFKLAGDAASPQRDARRPSLPAMA